MAILFACDYCLDIYFLQSYEKDIVIGTLNASSKTQLYYSYLRLAQHIKLRIYVKELSACEELSRRLQLLSNAVREELCKKPQWLLIVDDLTSEIFESDGMFPSFSYMRALKFCIYACRDELQTLSSSKWG